MRSHPSAYQASQHSTTLSPSRTQTSITHVLLRLPTYTTKDDAQKFTSSLTSEQLLTQLNISLLKLFSTLSSFLQHHQNAKLPYDDPFPDVRALRHPLSILFSKSSCSLLLGELEFTISTLHFSRRLRYEHS